MKKLIFLLLIPAVMASAQDPGIKAIYLIHQPVDLGTGIRVDYQVGNVEFYNSFSSGNLGLYRLYGLTKHSKLTFGLRMPLKELDRDYRSSITAGLNYHAVEAGDEIDSRLDPRIFNHWSFELGCCVYMGRLAIGARTDILRWEPCVDIGFNFSQSKTRRYYGINR